jgi:lipoprotein signal peptidase
VPLESPRAARRTPVWRRRLTASSPIIKAPQPPPQRPLRTFAIFLAGVLALDLVTKALAAGYLSEWHDVPIIHGLRLVLVHNDQSAFGVSLGPYTWQINCALTVVALVLAAVLCKPLTSIDRWAPVMLGLIAGAAAGNLYGLITTPHGVIDFVAVSHGDDREIVFNFADVAAAMGLLLTVRTVFTVIKVMREEQQRGGRSIRIRR